MRAFEAEHPDFSGLVILVGVNIDIVGIVLLPLLRLRGRTGGNDCEINEMRISLSIPGTTFFPFAIDRPTTGGRQRLITYSSGINFRHDDFSEVLLMILLKNCEPYLIDSKMLLRTRASEVCCFYLCSTPHRQYT